MFRNLETMFYEIKNSLLDSSDLKKLIFYNTPNALSRATPNYEEVAKYIYIKPIIFVYEESEEFSISSFISVGIVESVALDGSIETSVKVSVACQRQVWELDGERVRPLAILSEVVNQLDNKKLKMAGRLTYAVMKETAFNNELVGYTALFDISEEKGGVMREF